ncbi:MAG: cysteine--tRNA ligase [Verrucomicrobiia bacterium]
MGLNLFNTLSRSLERFVPLDPAGKAVGLYCCGPTIYDFGHIGNFRTFVFSDLLRRCLEFKGYAVKHILNITDVEDKIINRVREAGTTLRQFTEQFETAFFEDLETLGCLKPHATPRATEHIPAIIQLVEKLMANGFAYQAPDKSVYFSIEKYRASGARYGQLASLNFEEMRVGERVKSDEYAKESAADFALWKARAPEDGEVFWPSPWGEGRPGWHIECSAMSMQLLGPSFDIHVGGEDLIFPHHEDEIAQSEGAGLQSPGTPFVKYWLHAAHLLVDGKKMSKSLGNFYTLRDLLKKGFRGREIRYLLLTSHYREQFNFTLEGLQGARAALARLDSCAQRLREAAEGDKAGPDEAVVERLTAPLGDDLNISAAWGEVFDWVADLNRALSSSQLSRQQAAAAWAVWERLEPVFGLGISRQQVVMQPMSGATGGIPDKERAEVPAADAALLEERQVARKAKDFKRADAIRDELKARGWIIEDTPRGARLKRLTPG